MKGEYKVRKEKIMFREIFKLPVIAEGASSIILKDGDTVIKLYKPGYLDMEKQIGIDTERKMLRAKEIKLLPEIEIPVSMLYDERNNFVGVRNRYIKGVSYNEFINNNKENTKENHETIINCHDKFEDFLKRASKSGVVLPDFASCDNIIVTNGGKEKFDIKMIDYDGIQLGNERTMAICSSLMSEKQHPDMNEELIFTKKYLNSDNSFTSELNIYSQYVLFFLDLLHSDISMIGHNTPFGVITFDTLFSFMGLDDYDLQNKIWKLFQQNMKNEFLSDDKYTILEKYDIEAIGKKNGIEARRLVRKR